MYKNQQKHKNFKNFLITTLNLVDFNWILMYNYSVTGMQNA